MSIQNRVSNSPLVTVEIKKIISSENIVGLDLFLFNDSKPMVREKEIKEKIKKYDFSEYSQKYVHIYHSESMIIPLWLPMLLSKTLFQKTLGTFFGERDQAFPMFAKQIIAAYDFSFLQGKPVMIPGCTDMPHMESILMFLVERVAPLAKKISFGEACSSIPI